MEFPESGDGDASSTLEACSQPDGFVSDDSDCNDNDSSLTPTTDNDGDGTSSCEDCDDADANSYTVAQDGDCDGYSLADGDCDDNNIFISPFGSELVNDGIDQNCDGQDDSTMISAGHLHNCGVDSTGSVQCWGDEEYGQSTPP